MALKTLIRSVHSSHGRFLWTLATKDGTAIDAFRVFCEKNEAYAPRTQKRYAEAVSRFLDYLNEAGAFGATALSSRALNRAIEDFPYLLRDGSDLRWKRLSQTGASTEDLWLAGVAQRLDWRPLAPASMVNTLAAVNRFLRLSEALAREEFERAQHLGIKSDGTSQSLIRALSGSHKLPTQQVTRMRQNSVLGAVAKFAPHGVKTAARLSARGAGSQQADVHVKDFPLPYVMPLIEAATCWRDKALWLLLAASGIRTSEARGLLLRDVDFEAQMVCVMDPRRRRFALPEVTAQAARYKGRAVAMTYLFPPLRQEFFSALEMYLKLEYVPVREPGGPQYLFQYVVSDRRGLSFALASDSTLAKSFKKAVLRAGVPSRLDGRPWTPHSLRHLYGVYMLNDYPLDPLNNKFGLSLVEVQMLMGHSTIRATSRYARSKPARLMTRLQASDDALLGTVAAAAEASRLCGTIAASTRLYSR